MMLGKLSKEGEYNYLKSCYDNILEDRNNLYDENIKLKELLKVALREQLKENEK